MTGPLAQSPLAHSTPPERMHLLLTVATTVSRSLDPQEVAEASLWLALEAVDLRVGMVLLLQERQPIILASQGLPREWLREFQSAAVSLEGTIIDHALQTDVPLAFSDLRLLFDDVVVRRFRQLQFQSLICLPLQAPGGDIGVMLIASCEQRTFQIRDVDLLQAIAGQISTGLRNAWLFARSQRHLEELEAVTEAARTVVSSLDSNRILTQIMEEVTTRLDTEAAALLLLDAVKQELEFTAVAGPKSANLKGGRLKLGQGVAGWVAQHDQPLLVPDVSLDERHCKVLDQKTATVTRSMLCVPLRLHDQLVGVVEVINKRHGQFSVADQRFLELLSTFAAIARYVVEAHGGDISVESELGRGSTFTVCFPLAMNGNGQPDAHWAGSAAARGHSGLGRGSGQTAERPAPDEKTIESVPS